MRKYIIVHLMLSNFLISACLDPSTARVDGIIFQKLLEGIFTATIFALPNKTGKPRWSIG